MMAERRYGFRFSLPEGCVILLSLFLTSFLVFLFGVYVGKEVQARRSAQQIGTVRLPVPITADSPFSRLPAEMPAPIQRSAQEPVRLSEPSQNRSISPASPARSPTIVAASPTATPFSRTEKKGVPTGSERQWSVQVHATRQEHTARNIAKKLRDQGYAPVVHKVVKQGEVWYRVRVGKFVNEEAARKTVSQFRRDGTFPQAYPVSE